MILDPATKKSILASVIASILVIVFIQPILKLSGELIVWMGDNIYEGISNTMYRNAAIGIREKYSFLIFTLTLGIMTGVVVGMTITRAIKRKTSDGQKPLIIRVLRKMSIFLAIVFIIDVIYLQTTNYADFQMNASFNQRINILAPIKELRAEWASMNNRNDYIKIVEDMEGLAKTHKIEFPKLLWE
jgi:hypothetical protein